MNYIYLYIIINLWQPENLKHTEFYLVVSNFICDIKKYLLSNIFCMKCIFYSMFFVLSTFLYDVKHLVLSRRLCAWLQLVNWCVCAKNTWQDHYKKHGVLHEWKYSFLIITAYWIRGCEAICPFNQWS